MNIKVSLKTSCTKDGYGFYAIVMNDGKTTREINNGIPEKTTNNRMQLVGLIEAVKVAPTGSQIVLSTTNTYVPHGMKAFREWQTRNLYTKGGTKVANLDLWDELIRTAKSRKIFITVS